MNTPPNFDRAASRYRNALRRLEKGVVVQKSRIMDAASTAPKHLSGAYEFTDLSSTNDLDLDYYTYDLGRVQDVGRQMLKTFDNPTELVEATDRFNALIPNLRKARNPLTHISDDPRLDKMAWFSNIVNLNPDGSVEYLIDPDGVHQDAALEYIKALNDFLQPWISPSPQP